MNKFLNSLFNTRAAGFYLLVLASVIAVATFVENDFGTSSAQKIIYKSWWFSLLLVMLGATILVNIYRFNMIRQKKWGLLCFHMAIVIIIIGSGITRYFGYEGIMHIRENDASDVFLSSESYLQFRFEKDGQTYLMDEPVLFASLGDNHFEQSYRVGQDLLQIKVLDFIPNPVQSLKETENGSPIVKVVFGGADGRNEYFIKQGETRRIQNTLFNFSDAYVDHAVNLAFRNDSFLIKTGTVMTQTVMATRQTDTLYPNTGYHELKLRSLYASEETQFVFGDYNKNGEVQFLSSNNKVKRESKTALLMQVSINGNIDSLYVYGQQGAQGLPALLRRDDASLSVSYGAKPVFLPFSIKLYDFIIENYPGTSNPATYTSDVQLIDNRKNLKEDHSIYMNNILDYEGYRFFQSSFDRDELGTYLSVNYDFWGTWISYTGYILLTLGMILSLFSKKSRFHQLSQKIKNLREKYPSVQLIIILAIGSPMMTYAQSGTEAPEVQHTISTEHANLFSRLVVQDFKGRMKPVHTLTREVMRKLARKESLYGLSADQIVLGMFVNSSEWIDVPMIQIGKHETIHKQLNVSGKLASYRDFFNENNEYVLNDQVRGANNMQPVDRGVFEKELLKIDERVNIANMVYSGRLFKVVPIPDDPNNAWASTGDLGHNHDHTNSSVAEKFFMSYIPALRSAMTTGDYELPDKIIGELNAFQKSKGAKVMPSTSKVNAEILLNNINVFGRLSAYYSLLGLVFLIFLFLTVFKPMMKVKTIYRVLYGLMILGFAFHTLGLGLRWYVSGRAPWSNGYESMIYIAWTTVLAGILFIRKSFGGLAATMVLSATVLLVATLSYLDPEITPLVPVLKSYWLTIHVSLEAGSYGFLMLGAVIGLINLLLLTFLSERNKEKIYRVVMEMSYISEMTLIGGLFLVSTGTYLGGVWANESWGRYWGWDAKETWALVTILVYAFILHMRLIPKLNGLFAYNFASIFGLATVIMTYYGVNYYLSGMHSYAAGDYTPIPQWVYIATFSVSVISALAYWKKRKFGRIS